MSHGEQQHPVPDRSPAIPRSEYGTRLPSPLSSYPSSDTAELPAPPSQPTTPEAVARRDMEFKPPTLMEKWAAHASDSQFNALAGAIGGFTSGIVTCPLDVIKTKLQAQGGFSAVQKGRHVGHHKLYEGLLGTGRVIWRDEGIRGMYRGLGPIIMGYLPTWAVWFTVYNKSKVWMAQYHGKFPSLSFKLVSG